MAEPPTSAPAPAPAPPASAPVAPPRPPRWPGARAAWQLMLPALLMLVLLAAVVGIVGGGAVWQLRSAEGTAWLLARLPGVDSRGLEGALISERFAAERLAVKLGGIAVEIDGLRGDGMAWSWRP